MKTSNLLSSLLFGSLALAAPLDKRALVTKTELVVETVIVYTTVWDGQAPGVAEATSTTPGLFYEQPSKAPSSAAQPTSAAVVAQPSNVYTPPPASSTPAPEPVSVYTPPPAPPSSAAPAPEPSSVYTPPAAPVASSPPPAATSAYVAPASNSSPSGAKNHGDITIYDNTGAAGACGVSLHDTDMIVALAKPTWGDSTYDRQTGAATNPWCGQQITIEYKGKQVQAKIMDMCPDCKGSDIDLSHATWAALGLTEITRLQADWWKS